MISRCLSRFFLSSLSLFLCSTAFWGHAQTSEIGASESALNLTFKFPLPEGPSLKEMESLDGKIIVCLQTDRNGLNQLKLVEGSEKIFTTFSNFLKSLAFISKIKDDLGPWIVTIELSVKYDLENNKPHSFVNYSIIKAENLQNS